jgi:chemotaxis signal transduction protein
MAGQRGWTVTRADELRLAFDATFVDLPAEARSIHSHLTFGVGGAAFAVPTTEVRALVVDRRLVALPGGPPGQLGIIGVRGDLVPVYALGPLLGLTASGVAPRWVIVVAGPTPLGLAIDHFEGLVRQTDEDLAPPPPGADPFVAGLLRTAGAWRSVIRLEPILDHIRGAAARPGSPP